MTYTTIQIHQATKENLQTFKEYQRETYDEIINKLMKVFNMLKSEGELSDETLKHVEEAREDIKKGRVLSTKELLRELGV